MRRLGVGNGGWQTSGDAIDRQRLHDHPSGKRQHLRGLQAQLRSERVASGAGTLQAIGAGAGIGIAGVDHHGTDTLPAFQVRAAHLHRGSAKAVLREHSGHRSTFVQQKNGQVLAIGLADAGFGHANAQACNGVQFGGHRGGEVHWHGIPSKTGAQRFKGWRTKMKTRAAARVVSMQCLRPACRGTA